MYLEDQTIRLREFGTDIIHSLPQPPWDSAVIGSSDTAAIMLGDQRVASEHAVIERDAYGWQIRELGGRVAVDGVCLPIARINPAVEIKIGNTTLVPEGKRSVDLRCFMARLLGWSALAEVDHALQSIRMAATRRLPLVLCGPDDMISVAYSIHRRAMSGPFVVCDPRRNHVEKNARSACNAVTATGAIQRSIGGSICVWSRRLPNDFSTVDRSGVRLIVCSDGRRGTKPYHVEPIVVPPLSSRPRDLTQIIDEYADEAAAAMSAASHLTAADREWILRRSASSISEIEKGTRRLLAIRNHDDNTAAAARSLGMAPISLYRWIGRRERRVTVRFQ